MKSRFLVRVLGILLGISGVGIAQLSNAPPPDMHAGPPHDPARQLAHLTKSLNLTPEQQGQIEPILKEREAQMESLHGDTSLTLEESMGRAKAIFEQSDSAIEATLNPEQKLKFEKQRKAMQARMAHRHDHTSSPDAAPEPDGGGPPGGEGPPPDGPPGI